MQFAPPPTRRSRRGVTLLAVAAVVAVLVVVVAVVVVVTRRDAGHSGPADSSATPSLEGTPTWGRQVTVPLPGLTKPEGLAVTPDGGVYVVCCKDRRGAQLWIDEPGAAFPTHQSVPLLSGGIAVDSNGDLYYADNTKVAKLTGGGTTAATTLPFPDPDVPVGMAVDGAGAVYALHWRFVDPAVAKTVPEIWRLDPGAQVPVVTPLDGVPLASAIAVDRSGTVYVTDGASRRVLRYAPGAVDPTELQVPEGTPTALATDDSGAVYVACARLVSNGLLFRFAAGSAEAEKLPLDGVRWKPGATVGLAVDRAGNVYASDHDHDRVLRIPRLGA